MGRPDRSRDRPSPAPSQVHDDQGAGPADRWGDAAATLAATNRPGDQDLPGDSHRGQRRVGFTTRWVGGYRQAPEAWWPVRGRRLSLSRGQSSKGLPQRRSKGLHLSAPPTGVHLWPPPGKRHHPSPPSPKAGQGRDRGQPSISLRPAEGCHQAPLQVTANEAEMIALRMNTAQTRKLGQSSTAAGGKPLAKTGLGRSPRVRRNRPATFRWIVLWIGMVSVFAIAYVAETAAATQASYQIANLKQEQADLMARQQQIRYQISMATSAGQIDGDAAKLGMVRSSQWQYLPGSTSPVALAKPENNGTGGPGHPRLRPAGVRRRRSRAAQ